MSIKKYISYLRSEIESKHAIYGLDLLKIKKTLNSIRILGQYSPREKTLYINKRIYKVNKKKYKTVIRHEYAHFIVDLLFQNNVMPHGKEWKQIMRDLGDSNPRAKTSDFNKEVMIAYPHKFTTISCKCAKFNISIYQLKKYHKKRCLKCGKKLKMK